MSPCACRDLVAVRELSATTDVRPFAGQDGWICASDSSLILEDGPIRGLTSGPRRMCSERAGNARKFLHLLWRNNVREEEVDSVLAEL